MKGLWSLQALILAALLFSGCQSSGQDAERVGEMVLAIDYALSQPDNPDSLETIARYGTDSRYYVMIRGWLVQELQGVESQLAAASEPGRRFRFQQKADFLRQAIRRIDLE